ncbi:undecaprenyl-phosphate glucose phosphotransferase [Parvularcula sp. IMCC14364]|uniref:undecaprenyl-phosphate glucose phosphotransferase n=1 Tax=Parvularcula sp. IMCC14364 TaxID=3067902 RepID=UPI0027421B86|nr:undecaprenyl-phosphate glucose phosphotransferase [Parvularcula sp. IMCC14364]
MVEYQQALEGAGLRAFTRRQAGFSRKVCSDISAISTVAVVGISSLLASLLLGVYSEPSKYLSVGILGGILIAELYSHKGYYNFDRLLRPWAVLPGILSLWALALLILTCFAFLTDISQDFSRRWLVYWFVIGGAGVAISRFAMAYHFQGMCRVGGSLSRRVAVVGASTLAEKFISLSTEEDKSVQIMGVYDDRHGDPQRAGGLAISGSVDDLVDSAMHGGFDDIVICLPWSATDRINEIFRRLSVLPANTVVCPDMLWLENKHGGISHLGGVPLLNIHRRPLEGWGGILKAAEDRVVSSLLLAFLSPLMLLIALLIKLDSRGPVLFSQNRHGFQHDVFRIHKFRTMTVMENGADVRQATKGDMRVTRIGAFLRRYSLDELPQLWNVLKGDMSLVGPRPHAVAHNEQYAQVIADYAGRHRVKPGISGWAQVNGCRGETSENEMMEERVRHDLYYIENWSLFLDIRIILMTIWAVLFPKNAY